jgi:YhcG PDDEXK nuclease domain
MRSPPSEGTARKGREVLGDQKQIKAVAGPRFEPTEVGLSAADDQLRHETDGPSIGIILCKGKNEVIVEYALRDSAKPMGVAEYRLSAALPEPLQAELPTVAEFAREFPLMSLVKLRIEVERELRAMIDDHGTTERPLSIMASLSELGPLGLSPASVDRFRSALQTLNRAAHGLEVEKAANEASTIAAALLAELRDIRSRGAA